MAATGSWIYEITSTTPGSGGGGGGASVPAPPVTVGEATVREVENGKVEVLIAWTPAETATAANFTGVHAYLEDPDLSATKLADMDGTVQMDATTQTAGSWTPVYLADYTKSPALLLIPTKPADRLVRVYLLAYNARYNAPLHRANEADPTPNVQVAIPKGEASYVEGMEYAWHITLDDPPYELVEDFENPAGPKFSLKFHFAEPDDTIPLPPGLLPYGGVQTVFEYPSEGNRRATARFLMAKQPDTWISDQWAASTLTFKVYFCSAADANRVNKLVPGVTPMCQVTTVYPPPGKVLVPVVTNFGLSNARHSWEPDGTIFAMADITWTPPDSNRLGWVEFWLIRINGIAIDPPRELGAADATAGKLTLRVIDYPNVPQQWAIAAISVDTNGKLSDDPKNLDTSRPPANLTPVVIWNIGPISSGTQGQENTPVFDVGAVSVTTEQELNNDGVRMMRHKITWTKNGTDNSFGGLSIARLYGSDYTFWDAAKTATTLVTDWEPAPTARTWTFYFVARDLQNRRNTIVPGSTPNVGHAFTPLPGEIVTSRLPAGWWNEDEFAWPDQTGTGKFQAKNFVAEKIYVGSILRVGGGTAAGAGGTTPSFAGNYNGQIAVYNSGNVLRGWIGEQKTATPDNGASRAVWGGWFGELYLGGNGPPNSPLYVTNAGVVIVGGFEFLAGNLYAPYISIRDNTATEVGRIGARIARSAGGGALVPTNDPADISGAWFKEFAIGGTNLSDWRLLARKDSNGSPTQPDLFNIRNVNKFTIDYPINYNPPPGLTNPYNAAMKFEVGFDAYVADESNINYYKFPGLSITRTGTTHKAVLVNRGLVLHGPDLHTYNKTRMGAFITYNGNEYGHDPYTYWTELTMMSSTSGRFVVQLASGSVGNASSFFNLWDEAGNLNFSVSTVGNVTIRGTLTMSGAFSAGSYKVATTEVITSTRIFTGASVNVGTGSVTCGPVVASGAISGTSLSAGALGTISGGAITGSSVNVSGTVSGAGLSISGAVTFGALNCSSVNASAATGYTGGSFQGSGVLCNGFGVAGSGFNIRSPGVSYDGATVDVHFQYTGSMFLDLYYGGANVGAKKLKFVGGVLVGFV